MILSDIYIFKLKKIKDGANYINSNVNLTTFLLIWIPSKACFLKKILKEKDLLNIKLSKGTPRAFEHLLLISNI